MSDIFTEIAEEVQRDKIISFWKKYGQYISSALIALLVLIGGYLAYQQYQENEQEKSASLYAVAMQAARRGNQEEALQTFQKLSTQGTSGYKILADLEKGRLLSEKGEIAEAEAVYKKLSTDSHAPVAFKDLAILRLSVLELNTSLKTEEIQRLMDQLRPLTEPRRPWRPLAIEFIAVLENAAGDAAKARETLRSLKSDPSVLPLLQMQSQELLQGLE